MNPNPDIDAQDSRCEKVAAWCRQVGLDPDEIPAPTGARDDTTAVAVDEGHIEVTYRTFLRGPDGKHQIAIDPDGAHFLELTEPLRRHRHRGPARLPLRHVVGMGVDHDRRPRVVRVRLILEAARRRWIVDFQREDKTCDHGDGGDPQPQGDVYTQATIADPHPDERAPMDGRRTGF